MKYSAWQMVIRVKEKYKAGEGRGKSRRAMG